MGSKQLEIQEERRDIPQRINLYVQSNPALMGIVISVILLLATFIINPKGMNIVAVGNILLLTILLSIASAGQTIVLIGGGMDFGVGAVMSATAILTTYTMKGETGHFLQVLVVALIIGAAVGFLNGFCAVKIGLPAMIVTMAIANIVTRMQYVLTQGVLAGSASKLFTQTVIYRIGGVIPSIILYAAIIWPLTFFLLNRSRFGKQLFMVGNNPIAARLSGVRVNRIKILSYIISGMLSAFAGMLGAAYMSTCRCQIFDDYAYDSLIAVIIGGTAFSGGIGSYQGSIAGSLVMILLSNLLTTLQLTQPMRNLTQGVIMILLLMLYNRSKSVRQ